MNTHKHFEDVLKDFDSAMLITYHEGWGLHARPMAVACTEGAETYFATNIDSPKVAEIEANPRVLVTFQGNARFASLEGSARVIRDRELIERLWSPAWKVWFPGGKDDPSLCLLQIDPERGEYWDNSGTEGISYLIEGAKALFQGSQLEVDRDQNAKVEY